MPIFDQGYQHWQGPLSGHTWRWLAIARHGVRVQMKGRILRFLLLIAWLPAVGLIAAVAMWGLLEQGSESIIALVGSILPPDVLLDPRAFRVTAWTLAYSAFFKTEMYFIMLLVVVAGPGLISRDLRFNALPLYFARPMTRLDYFLGKLGVIAALVGAVAIGPAVFAYLVGVCFSLDLTVVRDTYTVLLASVAYGLVITLSIGMLMLAFSSLTRRSLYVGITWAGMWIISGTVGPMMTGFHRESTRRGAAEDSVTQWVAENPPPPGVEMRGTYPITRWDPDKRKSFLVGVQPGQEKEGERWQQAWSAAFQQSWNDAENGQGDVARRDWRPLFSYVANLERIADALLDTDSAWVAVGKAADKPRSMFGPMFGARAKAPPVNERRLANQMVPQYPWEWSAGVLAVLLGLSTWTLSRRVKSLDRLK